MNKVLDNLGKLFLLESILLLVVIAGLWRLNPAEASSLYLYEILGMIMALIITTGGIHKMRDIT